MRGATYTAHIYTKVQVIFQSTRPVRGATFIPERHERPIKFQSTRPVRGATLTGLVQGSNIIFQSTRPVRGATWRGSERGHVRIISIHAPRAGRDWGALRRFQVSFYFNPRAPCGARLGSITEISSELLFQSTRPVRGATSISVFVVSIFYISIHAPRAGRDFSEVPSPLSWLHFNPRAPCGARR